MTESGGGRPESRERFQQMDELAEELRKNIYMFWKHSKQEFGTAGMQKVCRDTIVVFIEKAMLAGERDMAERAAQKMEADAVELRQHLKMATGPDFEEVRIRISVLEDEARKLRNFVCGESR